MESERTVQEGDTIRLRYDDNRVAEITIRQPGLYAYDSIDPQSPTAKAVLGKAEGEEVEVELHPALPVRHVTIIEITRHR